MTIPRLGSTPPPLLNSDGSLTVAGLHSTANLWLPIKTATASFTFATSNRNVRANAASATIVGTLPAWASALIGSSFAVKKVDSSANAVGFAPSGSDTIDGVNGPVSTTTQYAVLSVTASDVAGQWDRGFCDYTPSNVTRVFRVPNIAITWPAMVANAETYLAVSVPGIKPQDAAIVTLGVGSNAPPNGVTISGLSYCTTAGTLQVLLINANLATVATAGVLTVTVISGS